MPANLTAQRDELADTIRWVIRRIEDEQNCAIRRAIAGPDADVRPQWRKAAEESLEECYAVLARLDLDGKG